MKCVISVLGKDRSGVVAAIATTLADCGANIDDISQTILGEGRMFSMTMMVTLIPPSPTSTPCRSASPPTASACPCRFSSSARTSSKRCTRFSRYFGSSRSLSGLDWGREREGACCPNKHLKSDGKGTLGA